MRPVPSRPRVVLSTLLVGSLFLAPPASGADLDHILFQTIRRNDLQSLRTLLRQGTPVDVRTADGTTPLLYAALRGSVECVELLLEHGADPNAANRIGATPLLWGATETEKVRLLLERGAMPHHRSALGNTPLLAAAAGAESSGSVELLLAAGADVHAANGRGRTALANAVFTGTAASVRTLVEAGAEVRRAKGSPRQVAPLIVAAQRGEREIVELLLRHGADPNEADESFAGNAVNYALLRQKPEITELLIASGGDIESPTPVGKVPPIVLAAYTETGDTSVAEMLISRGVDLNAANSHDETALIWARKRGHEKLIEILRKAGASESAGSRKKKEIPSRRIQLHAGNQNRLLKTSVEKSLNLLATSSDAFLKNRESCVSCHHQNLPGVAMAWARDRGFEVNRGSIDRMIERQVSSWSPRIDNAYEMDRPVPVPPRFLGWGLLGFSALGYPRDHLTDAMVWYLAATQQPDGYWIPGFLRPPVGGAEILATTLALRALQLYPLEGRERELSGRVQRARSWLRRTKPRNHQERVFRTLGLSWTGSSPRDLEDEVAALLAEQRDDGGWAQLAGMDSDAWATGQSLVALATAGGVDTSHPAYQRGMTYLLSTQFDDGSWFVESRTWPFQPHFDSRFPHGRDQWVSAPATAWATMALTLAVRPFADVVIGASRTDIRDQAEPSAETEESPPKETEPRAASRPSVDFVRTIRPILERSCLGCHGADKPKANLRLTSRALLLKGGESGESAIVPGRGAESLLVRFVSGQVEDMEMPPLRSRGTYAALTPKEVESLREWIDQGAHWPSGMTLSARRGPVATEPATNSSAPDTRESSGRTSRFSP